MHSILKRGWNYWRDGQASSTGLLIDARDYYKAIFDAAAHAKQSILMAGWQFNSDVRLLRGKDCDTCDTDTRLLPYLNYLCEKKPDLHVYILAWDFVEFLGLKREWRQSQLFGQSKTKRIKFLYDSRHAIGASHHQKMVVIDGNVAFVGGMDICNERWGDRCHNTYQNERHDSNAPCQEPFHDVQSYHTGPVAKHFVTLFKRSWMRAGGGKLSIPRVISAAACAFNPSISLPGGRVAICRTQSRTLFPPQRTVTEIRRLYVDAIDAAERLIYIENQYFSSKKVLTALIERMRRKDRPALQIVIVLPQMIKTFTEDLALGYTQARMLRTLKKVALQTGHALGVYYSTTKGKNDVEVPKLIHSKLFLIDDRFLSVGSANLANRSMGLDTELNVAWEATEKPTFIEAVRRIRVDLLSEHVGVSRAWADINLAPIDTLVETLEMLAHSPLSSLRHHQMATRFHWLDKVAAYRISLDPEEPLIEEKISEIARKLTTAFN